MKTNELTGEQLSYWVAKAQGWSLDTEYDDWLYYGSAIIGCEFYRPDQDPAQAFELIEKFGLHINSMPIDLVPNPTRFIFYVTSQSREVITKEYGYGIPADKVGENVSFTSKDLKTTICRAVVASVYGQEVSDE